MICMHAGKGKTESGKSARTNCARIFVDQSGAQCGQRREGLDSRTGQKGLRVRALRIHDCSDATGLRVHNNDGAFTLAQGSGRRMLLRGIEFGFVEIVFWLGELMYLEVLTT